MFYYADEFNVSWLPTLRAMWSPVGQQVMIATPKQPYKRYGLGAVNYHTGETVVIFRRRKRRQEVAELLEAVLQKHPKETIYLAWDNSSTHEDDDEVEAVVRAACGRLILLYLPTYAPWLNPIEMLWRHFRREVTHSELFDSVKAHRHGLWLGERFQNHANVVWTVGGDRYPAGYEAIYRAMAKGLRTGSGGKQMMTFHPNGGQSSARFFHNDDWLDFNMIQTWGDVFRIYPTVLTDMLRFPAKPVIMDEGAYEDGPEYPLRPITPLWIRRQAWWAWTAGGFYTYGHNSSWRVEQGWINDVESLGAAQMSTFKQIVTSRDGWRMSPCPCLIAEGTTYGKLVNTAMRTDDSRNAILYFSSQCYVQVNVGEIAASEAKATWVNPITGEEMDAGQHKTGSHWFKTPDFWEDAVLLLDAT